MLCVFTFCSAKEIEKCEWNVVIVLSLWRRESSWSHAVRLQWVIKTRGRAMCLVENMRADTRLGTYMNCSIRCNGNAARFVCCLQINCSIPSGNFSLSLSFSLSHTHTHTQPDDLKFNQTYNMIWNKSAKYKYSIHKQQHTFFRTHY